MREYRSYSMSDYEITKDGQVINKHNGHIVKPQLNGKGYGRVWMAGKLRFVHRLVAELYVPNPECKPQVNHIDGNKLNNNYTNLEWVTNQENRDHAVKNNLHLTGENCSWHKLTKENVDYIRKHLETPDTILAQKFGVAPTTISGIQTYRTWKD